MKFTKEQRSAIIRRVSHIAYDEYKKKLKEAMNNYVPSEDYKRLEKALHDREESCNIIRELWGNHYKTDSINIDGALKELKMKEINVKKPYINCEDLDAEIILSQCASVEELIIHLLELISKNNNN